MPRRLLMAPWSWPCSEGLVLRERRLWAAGQVKDIMLRKGMPSHKKRPVLEKPIME